MADPVLVEKPYEVIALPERSRFELIDLSDGERQLVGVLEYKDDAGVLTILHTIISERYARQGYARTLVTEVLNRLDADGRRIRSLCSYVDRYLERFPQYAHMLA